MATIAAETSKAASIEPRNQDDWGGSRMLRGQEHLQVDRQFINGTSQCWQNETPLYGGMRTIYEVYDLYVFVMQNIVLLHSTRAMYVEGWA